VWTSRNEDVEGYTEDFKVCNQEKMRVILAKSSPYELQSIVCNQVKMQVILYAYLINDIS
jgi:hypothetical protein